MIPDVSKSCIHNIWRDSLGYAKVCTWWVPIMLTDDNKWQRVEAVREFLHAYETDGDEFLDSVVTGDETCVHYMTPETKEQSCQWKHPGSPKPKKFKEIRSASKVMANVFWGREGLLLCEFLPTGTTINADRYCRTFKNLRCVIKNKRRGMLTIGVRLHQDNARPHTARVKTDLINRFGWNTVTHPPNCPDLAPVITISSLN
nr:histone-lysine N-methyltransferase SETMAR-like [Parasteatoda tepidariorum]